MRIIVMSDSHGSYSAIESIIARNTDADWIFHLGDGERELDRYITSHPMIAQKIIHFHSVSRTVPSAASVLTVVFGMGTGVAPMRIATGNFQLSLKS